MDKPNVARRIVRAIRQGNPPGRFMKKSEDGKWYDVGDRTAAEKTSQGLRERSNAEKRQRSALREALRIRREDLEEGKEGEPASKKTKTDAYVPSYVGVAGQLNYTGGIPLSLSMKEQSKDGKGKKGKKGKDDDESESLPPNAVDKEGNVLVTAYDILVSGGRLCSEDNWAHYIHGLTSIIFLLVRTRWSDKSSQRQQEVPGYRRLAPPRLCSRSENSKAERC
jgi:hypothetical protein